MTRRLLLLIVLSLVACREDKTRSAVGAGAGERREVPTARTPCREKWQEVGEGARHRHVGCDEDGSYDLDVVELDPEKWRIDAAAGPRRPMLAAVQETNAAFAINANFFDQHDRPLGVVVTSGKPVQPPHPVSWQSVFWMSRDGEPAIASREDWDAVASGATTAVQAGPRLVVAGKKNEVAKASPSLRSGVCIGAERQLRFFVTPQDSFMDVHEVVELAAKSESEGGIGCRDAMLFDGGPSAQMYLDTPQKKIAMEGDVVPVYVVAKPK